MCPDCWEKRALVVPAAPPLTSPTALFTASLVLGLISVLPLPAVMMASVVVGVMALVKSRHPDNLRQRWKPLVGLAVTLVSAVLWLVVAVR